MTNTTALLSKLGFRATFEPVADPIPNSAETIIEALARVEAELAIGGEVGNE